MFISTNKHRVGLHLTIRLPISPFTLELFQINTRQIIKTLGYLSKGLVVKLSHRAFAFGGQVPGFSPQRLKTKNKSTSASVSQGSEFSF